MKKNEVINLVKILEKIPIEVILVKHLMMDGIDTEEKLVNLIKSEKSISEVTKVKLQNYFRDIEIGTYGWNFNKIPNVTIKNEKKNI